MIAVHDTTLKAWDCRSGKLLWETGVSAGYVLGVRLSRSGNALLVTGDDAQVHLLDAATGEELGTLDAGSTPLVADFGPGSDEVCLDPAPGSTVKWWFTPPPFANRTVRWPALASLERGRN